MVKLRLGIADGSEKTGAWLKELLKERGFQMVKDREDAEAVISYGIEYRGYNGPILNANAGNRKKTQLKRLGMAGIPTPRFMELPGTMGEIRSFRWPVLARKDAHMDGNDIALTLQSEDLRLRREQGFDFITEFIPIKEEYRVFVYRRQLLGSYIKILAHPEKYLRIGRTEQNGWEHEFLGRGETPEGMIEICAKAVDALKLDFGAVDVIQSKENDKFYVLEVNTAPGVNSIKSIALIALANKIGKWHELDYPKRKGA